ncbi:aldo-keto reductase family 1 member B1-like [Ostrinia nubilalis]|uniref:aldo-keto reductase family 1 member B1-like n=1 Tax=Ostrinia nubilalis TaxID=29057 RepID=UPI0030824F95
MAVPLVTLNTGYNCPMLGLGTWQSKPGEVKQAVKDAIDVGYRHIDCAFLYYNEAEVGQAIKEKIKAKVVRRKDLFLTSKLWCTFHNPDLVEAACRKTMADLGVDYLDLYLIHFPQGYEPAADPFAKLDDPFAKLPNGRTSASVYDYVDTWIAMEALVEKGLVRSIGVSNFNKRQLDRVLGVATIIPAMQQIEVHPYLNNAKLIDYCRSKGIAVTAYSPLGSPERPWAKPGEPNLMDDPRLTSVAQKYKKSVPQILIRYALDRGLVVIPKSVKKQRIADNFNVLDFKLQQEDMEQIASLECRGRVCDLGDSDHRDYPFFDEY